MQFKAKCYQALHSCETFLFTWGCGRKTNFADFVYQREQAVIRRTREIPAARKSF